MTTGPRSPHLIAVWRHLFPKKTRILIGRWFACARDLPRLWRVLGLRPTRGRAAVFYGSDHLPGPDVLTHGGLVKLQSLAASFPNTPRAFNILYVVSSHLPASAVPFSWLAQWRAARVVLNQDGVAYPGWHGPGWQQTNAPMAFLVRRAEHVFYQSEFCKRAADRFLGEPGGSWEVLHNCVDTELFAPRAADGPLGPLVLLLAGNQDNFYRVETSVHALKRLIKGGLESRLIITGRLRWSAPDGAERAARALVVQLGLEDRVEFAGPYTQQQAPAVFRRGDLLLHPKYNDPCPGVVVEALASGLPVVYSQSGGVPELVGEEAGIGVPAELSWERELPPAPDALADAVAEVARRRREFSKAARARAVAHFGLEQWLHRHRDVFERLHS